MDKILKIQTEIGVLSKTETNPFYKSKYMDINGLLAHLVPLLAKHKLTVIQPLTNIDGRPAIFTIVLDEDKEILRESMPLPDLQDPQKVGSAITYYRRYALQSLFLLQAEDDDGNHASKTTQKPKMDASEAIAKAKEAITKCETMDDIEKIQSFIEKSQNLPSIKTAEGKKVRAELKELINKTINDKGIVPFE